MTEATPGTAIRDGSGEEPLPGVAVGICATTNYPVRELRRFLRWGAVGGSG